MLHIGDMELLPIIIIVSLLGFFIILTLILFTCVYLRAREARRRRQSSDSEPHHKPTRKLTLQSGKAIPTSEAQETASTRRPHSLDLTSPMPIFTAPTYTVTCEAGDPSTLSRQHPVISAQDHGHPPILPDLEAQIPKPYAENPRRAVSEPNRPKKDSIPKRVYSIPVSLTTDRKGSLTVPRPALVVIESRRPSAARSSESPPQQISDPNPQEAQRRRSSASRGQEITDSLQKAYQGPLLPGGQALELPTSPVLWNSWAHAEDSRESREGRPSGQTLGSPAVSSRVVSDSIQRPPPLFSGRPYSPRVKFAPPTEVDYTRVSFLSMTDSSVASEQISPISPVGPTMRAPPPSTVEFAYYESPPPLSRKISSSSRRSPPRLRNTPPHLEIPDFGRISFFDSETSSDEPHPPLQRVLSRMSHRSNVSNFTIASSEVSSANWTFGNAKVINIYPSVAQEKERNTPPPYAKTLRSKYGQYPRGRRNKALPVIPKSPLSQSEFGPL